jgi:hypothetical protein
MVAARLTKISVASISGNLARPLTGRGRVLFTEWRTNEAGVSFTLVTLVRYIR